LYLQLGLVNVLFHHVVDKLEEAIKIIKNKLENIKETLFTEKPKIN